jgi:Uma2 family endonuclease
MVRRGILTDDDPVELLQGLLVTKMPKNPPHRIATGLLREALRSLCPPGWYVDSQEPITTNDSEPEPDVAVIRGETKDYSDRHPGPGDVALVAEVADATLERDRTVKKSAYGRAGIAVYWIVNLVDRRIEVYSEPAGPDSPVGYRQHRQYGVADEVPVVIAGQPVGGFHVQAILP